MLHKKVIDHVIAWIKIADEDLAFAQHGLTLKRKGTYRLVAFHAQQCVEKYLKAFLVYKKVDFPYTHNISILLEWCSKYTKWREELKDAEELTPYALSVRYPTRDEEVTREDAIRAIFIANSVRNVVRNVLNHEGVQL